MELARDGEEGWKSVCEFPRRLVFSDWKMPGLDGLELCRHIRERGGDYTYFILLSNLANSAENLDQAMEAGADDFLAKPAKPTELKARLRVAERILNYATQVRQLQGIIPVCGYCRKMRDDLRVFDVGVHVAIKTIGARSRNTSVSRPARNSVMACAPTVMRPCSFPR